MNDDETCIADLKDTMAEFVAERNWNQYHSPKNLAMSLTIEAGELMEHFQWLTTDESQKIERDSDQFQGVSEELADVFAYTLAIANEMQIDLSKAFAEKMEKNRAKYPVEQFKGRYGQDDPKPVEK